MKQIEKIKEISRAINSDALKESMKNGRGSIGYFCSYVPEEIIAAAGFIPYRMRGVGSENTDLADTYYSSTNCLYPRHILDLAMKGDYSFLDGIIFSNSCDHTRRLYDIWLEALPGKPGFLHFLDVPHLMGEVQERRYRDILRNMIEAIETEFSCRISDENLLQAAKSYNTRRRLLRSIYTKRTVPNSEFRGSDFLSLMLAVTALAVEKGNELLQSVNDELKDITGSAQENSLRVVLAGGCMEETGYLEMIENSGITIVEDNSCLGWRHFDGDISETGDILMNIGKRYLDHLSCPRMSNDYARRLSHVNDIVKSGRADAVILGKMPFCILYSGETHLFKEESKKHGYPLLVIERGYGDKSEGQYKTRIQAFVEEVKNRKGLK